MRTATVFIAAGFVLAAVGTCPATDVHWVPAHYLVPQEYYGSQVTSGDLDGDEDVDISFVRTHYWSVGTLDAPAWALDTNVYGGVAWCAERMTTLGDVDSDGDLDLVVTCDYYAYSRPRLFENVGTPTSPLWAELVGTFDDVPDHLGPLEPSLADIDADGDLDLLILNDFGAMILIENTGGPSTPSWSETGYFSGLPIHGSADFGDIDGDGDLDLVAIGVNSPARCWENVGSPERFDFSENASMLIGVDDPQCGWGIELLDIDRDGDADSLISPAVGEGNFLYLNERITPVQPVSWTSIKALYR